MYTHYVRYGANIALAQVNTRRENIIKIVCFQMNETTQFIGIFQQLYFNHLKTKSKENKCILIELNYFMNENIVVGESFKWPFIQQLIRDNGAVIGKLICWTILALLDTNI